MSFHLQKGISNAYLIAKKNVIEQGYEDEITNQISLKYITLTESFFLKEFAWVVLSSGMNEKVIRKIFPSISKAFCNWISASAILSNNKCRNTALTVFNHHKKIDAIIITSKYVEENTFEFVHQSIRSKGVNFIRQFPFMGPATSYHLAKNLGLQVVKPDRHLVRIAHKFNFMSVFDLCTAISEYVGDDLAEIDLVLWRYATLETNYLDTLYTNSRMYI